MRIVKNDKTEGEKGRRTKTKREEGPGKGEAEGAYGEQHVALTPLSLKQRLLGVLHGSVVTARARVSGKEPKPKSADNDNKWLMQEYL